MRSHPGSSATGDEPWTVIASSGEGSFLSAHTKTGCVIGGTAWLYSNDRKIARDSLNLLVVDEAGQFALAPTIACAVAAKRLLLLGDPQQLPQVTQGVHAEPVDESALGWLVGDNDTIPGQLGFFLAESYRMHPAVCSRVSALSYGGSLTAAPAAAQRHLDGIAPGVHVIPVEHSGRTTESPEEADAVVAAIQPLVGALWLDPGLSETPRPLTERDFLVVAPYNAQVACIRAALETAGLPGARVGTVDKFQGQEAPVVALSMTASSSADAARGMEFLLSRNRLNVAVSRAQWASFIVRSPRLTAFLPSSAKGVVDLGAFVQLCQ